MKRVPECSKFPCYQTIYCIKTSYRCSSCHTATAPAGHFTAQCSQCHTQTDDWRAIQFDHTGLTDCSSCHVGTAPAGHYSAQCSQCHTSTSSWASASFNHSGFSVSLGQSPDSIRFTRCAVSCLICFVLCPRRSLEGYLLLFDRGCIFGREGNVA